MCIAKEDHFVVAFPMVLVLISTRLYIGDIEGANDSEELKKSDIRAVVTCGRMRTAWCQSGLFMPIPLFRNPLPFLFSNPLSYVSDRSILCR